MVSDRVTSQRYHVTAIKQAAPEPRSGGIVLTDPRGRWEARGHRVVLRLVLHVRACVRR